MGIWSSAAKIDLHCISSCLLLSVAFYALKKSGDVGELVNLHFKSRFMYIFKSFSACVRPSVPSFLLTKHGSLPRFKIGIAIASFHEIVFA